jgi:hypothetical protein
MFKIYIKKIAQLFCSLLFGMVSFTTSGIIACIVTTRLDFLGGILYPVIAYGLGGLLLALSLGMSKKTGRMVLAGIAAWTVSLLAGSIPVDFIVSIYRMITDFCPYPGFDDGYFIISMGVIFGAVFGAIAFGRKTTLLFSMVCVTVSIPFGLLLDKAMQAGNWIKAWLEHYYAIIGEVNIYLLILSLSFGIGTGLSVGIHKMLIKRDGSGARREKT